MKHLYKSSFSCIESEVEQQDCDIKISVIIPIYNVEEYLCECLDSIISQTLKDIEIILVDDCSNDNSGKLADSYALRDKRIIIIHKEKNESVMLARKTGIFHAKGKYTMFVDSDDFLTSKNSLQIVYDLIENERSDILQFHSCVYSNNENVKKYTLKFINRHIRNISSSEDIIRICFLEGRYPWTLWNKIYRTDIVKKSHEYIEDVYINVGEDIYEFFLISYFSNLIISIKTECIYTYRYNIKSNTRKKELDYDTFKDIAGYGKTVILLLGNFLKKVDSYYRYKNVLEAIGSRYLEFSISYGLNNTILSDIGKAFSWLIKNYTISDIVKTIWMIYKNKEDNLIQKLNNLLI